MDIFRLIWKTAGLLLILVGIFYAKRKIEEKVKGPGGAKWRLRIGLGQFIIAVSAYIWARGHSPYRGTDEMIFSILKGNRVFGKEMYVAVLIGIVILALVGVGDIVIGILSYQKEESRVKSKE